jgi:hypothetical protein
MRLVERTGENEVALQHQWLPTFIGMNRLITDRVGQRLLPEFAGAELNEQTLDRMHARVLEVLVEMFPECRGLGDYLDGIKFVNLGTGG